MHSQIFTDLFEVGKLFIQVAGLWVMVGLGMFGVWSTVTSYKASKRKDRLQQDVAMRREFILNETLRTVAIRIEHSDPILAEMLEILNSAEDPTAPGVIPEKFNDLHRDLDAYVNHLEAIASLRVRGWLEEDDLAGLWEYYIGLWCYYLNRIWDWEPLREYVFTPLYGWRDIVDILQRMHGPEGHRYGMS